MPTCILFFTGHDGILPHFSHTKLGLFSHRPDPPPVNTPEHSLPEANISKEMLSSVKLSTQWCWLPHGNTHLSSKSESYCKKCLRKQALSQKTKDSYMNVYNVYTSIYVCIYLKKNYKYRAIAKTWVLSFHSVLFTCCLLFHEKSCNQVMRITYATSCGCDKFWC